MAKDNPQSAIDLFRTRLQRQGLPPALLVHGPESHFRSQALRLALAAAGELEVEQLDGAAEPAQVERLGSDLRTASLFGGGKVVVLRESLSWSGGGAPAPLERPVLSFLEKPTPGIHLVILRAGKVDGRSRLVKGVEKCGGVVLACRRLYATPFPGRPPWQTELHAWLGDQARRRKLQIEPQGIDFIVTVLGRAPGELVSFLDRLRVHLPGEAAGRVGPEVLEKVLGHGGQSTQFELATALLQGDFPGALARARSITAGGLQDQGGRPMDPAGALLVTLGWIHRALAQCYRGRLLLASGRTRAEVERELGLRYFKERFWAEVEGSSRERLEGMLEALLRADRLLKTANEDPGRILENFVIEAAGSWA
jgi:DNA polymerase III delta subunit